MAESSSHEDLIKRLKRIEGQIRGIQRMVDQDRPCGEILAQLSAASEAVRSVSALLAEKYALECLESHDRPKRGATKPRETVAALIDALLRAPR
jgi:CsoR family transcriptional regulator, copper-sensing transcriptional repressor